MSFYFFYFLFGLYLVSVALLVWRLFLLRRQFGAISPLRLMLTSILAVGGLILIYAWLIEPQIIQTNEYAINLNGKTNIRAVVIADIQAGPVHKQRFVKRVVEKVNALQPDIILYAGDFIERHANETKYLTSLQNLRAPLGIFGVLGNHDVAGKVFDEIDEEKIQYLVTRLNDLNVKILVNEAIEIKKDNSSFILIGTDEIKRQPSIPEALENIERGKPLIVLSHEPDIIDVARMMNADLVIAGHTHGGQIRLPLAGAITTMSALPRKYDRGLFTDDFQPTKLFITSGLGVSIMPLRFLSPPEIAVLNINF